MNLVRCAFTQWLPSVVNFLSSHLGSSYSIPPLLFGAAHLILSLSDSFSVQGIIVTDPSIVMRRKTFGEEESQTTFRSG